MAIFNQYKYTAVPLGLEPPAPAKSVVSDTWLMWCCHNVVSGLASLILLITLPFSIWCSLKIVPDYERMIVFRLGRVRPPKGPGLVVLLPLIDQFQRVDLRTRAFSVQPSKVKSRDDVPVSLRADVHYRVCDPILSVMSVQDLSFVIQHTAENLLAQSLGHKYLREIYGDRRRIAEHLKEDINEQVKQWGVSVDHVELQLEAVLRSDEEHVSAPVLPPAMNAPGGLEQIITQLVSLARPTPTLERSPATALDLSFQKMACRLEGILSPSLVSEVGASYQLYVTLHTGEKVSYFINLTSGSGSCGWGVLPDTPDVTLEMTEADLVSLIKGDLSTWTAYTTSKLRVVGDLQTALRLKKVLQKISEA